MHHYPSLPLRSLRRLAANRAVAITDARLSDPIDPEAPAHAGMLFRRLRLDGSLDTECWLIAESWWAENFSPPSFGDLGRWGLRIVPWTLGSHFGTQVRRRLDQHRNARVASPEKRQNGGRDDPEAPRDSVLRRFWRAARWCRSMSQVLASIAGLAAGLVASVPILAILQLLVAAALVPIQRLRVALFHLQQRIASTLGDSYILVNRPIEEAFILGQVQRDVAWLASRCKVVAVVAHSQGGAVAHDVLRRGHLPSNLKLLFTFGSGLKKLEQLRHLTASGGTYSRSAALTLLAMAFFGISASWFALRAWTGDLKDVAVRDFEPVVVMALYVVISLWLLVAGIKDHLVGIDLPNVSRWANWLTSQNLWVDCYATKDPVPNGILLDELKDKGAPIEVCNQSSILRDHTAYWSNRDEFVSSLVDRLTACREKAGLQPLPDLATGPEILKSIGTRRRWRVGFARAIGSIGGVSVLLAVVHEWQAWQVFLVHTFPQPAAWIGGLSANKLAMETNLTVSWPALGLLALAAVPFSVARRLWKSWNETEMRSAVERFGYSGGWSRAVFVAFYFQLVCAAGIALQRIPQWYFWVLFTVIFVFATARDVQLQTHLPDDELRSRESTETDSPSSQFDRSLRDLWNLANFLVAICIIGWWLAKALAMLSQFFFDGLILGVRPDSYLGVGVIIAIIGAGLWIWWQRMRGRP